MWKIKYWGRILVEKPLGILGIENIQEDIKKIRKRHQRIDKSSIERRIDRKISQLKPIIEKYHVSCVHEQGTGWHGIDLVVFFLLGVEKIYTTDIRDLLKQDLLKKTIIFLTNNQAKYPEYQDKIFYLSNITDMSIDKILHAMNVVYTVNDNFKRLSLTECKGVNMFYSDSVLQRFKFRDLHSYVEATKQFPPKKAIHVHRIDCKDFMSIRKESIVPPLHYLTINSTFWEFITCKKLNYQNRLRYFDFVNIFETAGFDVSVENKSVKAGVQEYVEKNRNRMSFDISIKTEDISVCSFDLIAVKR